jgi:hypothetical protein
MGSSLANAAHCEAVIGCARALWGLLYRKPRLLRNEGKEIFPWIHCRQFMLNQAI